MMHIGLAALAAHALRGKEQVKDKSKKSAVKGSCCFLLLSTNNNLEAKGNSPTYLLGETVEQFFAYVAERVANIGARVKLMVAECALVLR